MWYLAKTLFAEPQHKLRGGLRFLVHLFPALLLAVALLGLLRADFSESKAASDDTDPSIDPTPRVTVFFDADAPKDAQRGAPLMRFGLLARDRFTPGNPAKKLTFDPFGQTNSTVVRVNDVDRVFGFPNHGSWEGPMRQVSGKATTSTFLIDKAIRVTQKVEVILGEPIAVGDGFKRMFDTCLVRYTIENTDGRPRDVGPRIVVDTCIGLNAKGSPNDGMLFTVPTRPGLVEFPHSFKCSNVRT